MGTILSSAERRLINARAGCGDRYHGNFHGIVCGDLYTSFALVNLRLECFAQNRARKDKKLVIAQG